MYSYITENNLEYTQHYMYTKFEGYPFINAYLKSRAAVLFHSGEKILMESIDTLYSDLVEKIDFSKVSVSLKFSL